MLEELVSEQSEQRISYIYIDSAGFYVNKNSVFNALKYTTHSYDSYS